MYSSDDEIIDDIIIEASRILLELQRGSTRKRPSARVNPYLTSRKCKGRFSKDFADMLSNEKSFQENFHMKVEDFENLLELLEAELAPKKHTRPEDEITPREKLAVVLEYFASGSIQRHMASIYRISKQHLGKIIDDVCDAICKVLKDGIPALNEETFVDIANGFQSRWNFPNCIGALDAKHVTLKAPKGHHSIVLIAIADASYKFIYLDVGALGSAEDANIFAATNFCQAVLKNTLSFPKDVTVNGKKLPYFFIGNDAFPLHKRIMKSYTTKKLSDDERSFNYRLSRARHCVENAFGILCLKWLCLRKTMFCSLERAQKVVRACCFLHNYLLKKSKECYCPPRYADYYSEDGTLIEGEWRQMISDDTLFASNLPPHLGQPSNEVNCIRNHIKGYVNSQIGSLPLS